MIPEDDEEIMKDYVLSIVAELQTERENSHLSPVCVTYNSIIGRVGEDVKAMLRKFVKDGTMQWHVNINQIPMFQIKK